MKNWKYKKLPTPRLQFTWVKWDTPDDEGYNWECKYELVLHLGKHDIRNPHELKKDGELYVSLGGTRVKRYGNNTPLFPDGRLDIPFRDSAHALWDSEQLGGLPVFIKYDKIIRDRKDQLELNNK